MQKSYNKKIYILVGIFMFCLLIFFHYYQIFYIKGNSMQPTLQSGQYVLARKTNQDIGNGDVIIIQVNNKQIVKRVAALPNERISYNGKEIALHKDEYYVLGDNQEHSVDSRLFGPIKKEQIIGKVLLKELLL